MKNTSSTNLLTLWKSPHNQQYWLFSLQWPRGMILLSSTCASGAALTRWNASSHHTIVPMPTESEAFLCGAHWMACNEWKSQTVWWSCARAHIFRISRQGRQIKAPVCVSERGPFCSAAASLNRTHPACASVSPPTEPPWLAGLWRPPVPFICS